MKLRLPAVRRPRFGFRIKISPNTSLKSCPVVTLEDQCDLSPVCELGILVTLNRLHQYHRSYIVAVGPGRWRYILTFLKGTTNFVQWWRALICQPYPLCVSAWLLARWAVCVYVHPPLYRHFSPSWSVTAYPSICHSVVSTLLHISLTVLPLSFSLDFFISSSTKITKILCKNVDSMSNERRSEGTCNLSRRQ